MKMDQRSTSCSMRTPCSGLPFLVFFLRLANLSFTSADNSHCKPNVLKIPSAVGHRPLKQVIAHRGASAYLPEHSIASYRLALELGADWFEPDIVATKDKELIAVHTVDLNITTDVADVFPDRAWFSPFGNRTGFWTFNFTLEEIRNLTIRQRLPDARTTMYDGLFTVPTLSEILDTLTQWNEVDLPQRLNLTEDGNNTNEIGNFPSELNLHQAGIYLELKDAGWLQSEADLDLVDLLYQHIGENLDQWSHVLKCWDEVLFDQYVVPGLVVQAFDGEVLRAFHQQWNERTSQFNMSAAEPSYVLLATKKTCREPGFWLDFGRKYRGIAQGLGLDKVCLLESDPESVAAGDIDPLEKSEEFGVVLHPWTERPENEDIDPHFEDTDAELEFMYCKLPGVHAVFIENVDAAVARTKMGCSEETVQPTLPPENSPSTPGSPPSNTDCHPESNTSNSTSSGSAGSTIGSFVAGLVVAIVVSWGVKFHRERHRRTVVPTSDNGRYGGYDLEMT